MRTSSFLMAVAMTLAIAGDLRAQTEPETRAEQLRREREAKATQLQPPEPSKLEKTLLDLEAGRLFERILNPAEGLYPKFGSITAGSGFSIGPGYRTTHKFGDQFDFSTFAMASMKKYWVADARMLLPRLLDERLGVDVHAQAYDFNEELFFGIGADSARSDLVKYGLRNAIVGGSVAVRPTSWLTVSGGTDFLNPHIHASTESDSITSRFDDS